MKRWLGVPLLFVTASSGVGFSIYFALGVVADRALGLTPVIFLATGLFFAITTMTYVEGGAMFQERGGSSTFARHAFNELISFIAGWAILIDYLIVISLAAITVPHYLTPISSSLDAGVGEVGMAGVVIAFVAGLNMIGYTGSSRLKALIVVALGDLALRVAIIVVGVIVVWNPSLLTDQLNLFTTPSVKDIVYAFVLSMVAFAGIEAASNLAPDIQWDPGDLKRVIGAGAVSVPLLYAAVAAVALMAVPVVPGPNGPHTALAGGLIEQPVLGVVNSYRPQWVADILRWSTALIAVPVLVMAANTAMLGLSRHVYTLATNRQIPSWLGKLFGRNTTPRLAITIAAVLSFALAIPGDVRFLAGIYAFGATLALAIAHGSIVKLRITDPDRERPYKVPLNIRVRGTQLPLPAIVGAVIAFLSWISVILLHRDATLVGGGWMIFGLGAYVVYRLLVEDTSLTKRVSVPASALAKRAPEIEYGNILVPVFGTKLDDDIVATAGRLADAEVEEGETPPRLEVIYVAERPLTVPIDSPLPKVQREKADRALKRAKEVAEEYDSVDVHTDLVAARQVGAAIIDEANRRGAEVIIMGAEPPTRIRGGAVLGGIGAARPEEVGKVTEYVMRKAPCRVLLTAPPDDSGPVKATPGGEADSTSGL
ncbi:MAG: basic amino acid/polyamine antiporter, family [Solirubrobacterales bacterium]|nr:basic amino acid/polyamine antiporter, family [Solirubrobacterales bacterium]